MIKSSSNSRRIAQIVLILFALIGVYSVGSHVIGYYRLPKTFTTPKRFLIVEIHSSQDRPVRLYFEGASGPDDLQFEGPKLNHSPAPMVHFQSAAPLSGYTVSGTGQIRFGSAMIDIQDGAISINGTTLRPSEFTVGLNGYFREGDVRIAR